MGTKFGNLHVRTSHVEEVIDALKELVRENSMNAAVHENASGLEELVRQAHMTRNIFYAAKFQENWVSVLNDWFGWGAVESFGEALSSYLPTPLLTCSYFDDDVLEINVYQNGGLLTGQIWCSDYVREDYGLENKELDVSIVSEILGHQHVEKITQAVTADDREHVIQELETILGIPLWIHSDWFQDIGDDEITSKYTKYDLNTEGS